MKSMVNALWQYFVDMNSEKGGGVSIKRNVAWGVATLLVFVQVWPVVHLKYTGDDVTVYVSMVKFMAVLDASLILLVLGITSIEKIQSLVQSIRPGGGTMQPPAPTPTRTVVDTSSDQ